MAHWDCSDCWVVNWDYLVEKIWEEKMEEHVEFLSRIQHCDSVPKRLLDILTMVSHHCTEIPCNRMSL